MPNRACCAVHNSVTEFPARKGGHGLQTSDFQRFTLRASALVFALFLGAVLLCLPAVSALAVNEYCMYCGRTTSGAYSYDILGFAPALHAPTCTETGYGI